jgi:hypothetical protein
MVTEESTSIGSPIDIMEVFMLRLSFTLALSLLTCPAMAARPSTLDMTCDQARNFVASHGAVVMTTGRFTFERFVAHAGYCMWDEYAAREWAPTRDASQCLVGYACRYRPSEDDFFFFFN